MTKELEKRLSEAVNKVVIENDEELGDFANDFWWAWADEGEDCAAETLKNWYVKDATEKDAIDLMDAILPQDWDGEGEEAIDKIWDFLCGYVIEE